MTLNAEDRILRAKILMQRESPFFSWLVSHLKIREDNNMPMPTMGVDAKGNLYYDKGFVESLESSQLKTVLCHEVLHVALQHPVRGAYFVEGEQQSEKHQLWNIAIDICVNNVLSLNNFDFSGKLEGVILPRNNEITLKGTTITIKEIDKKTAEEIYNILSSHKNKKQLQKNGYTSMDYHIFGKGKPSEGEGEEEIKGSAKEWGKILAEASAYAQQQGKHPLGMQRYIDDLLNPKMNWRELLQKYITREIPCDYSYDAPSKRSRAIGIYLPRTKKELVDITIAVDTSGSIGKEELKEFLSEIVGIGKSFEMVRMNLFFIDTKVHNHYILDSNSLDEILTMKIDGGGGTDFRDCYKFVQESIPQTKILVFFTDLYATFPDEEEVKTLWIVTKDGDKKDPPFGEVARL